MTQTVNLNTVPARLRQGETEINLVFRSLTVILLLIIGGSVSGCRSDCRSVCTHQIECFGTLAGDPDLCTNSCNAQVYDAKQKDLDCVDQASCSELKNGLCAVKCSDVCASAHSCFIPATGCTDRCEQLALAQRECLHRIACTDWEPQCGSTAVNTLRSSASASD